MRMNVYDERLVCGIAFMPPIPPTLVNARHSARLGFPDRLLVLVRVHAAPHGAAALAEEHIKSLRAWVGRSPGLGTRLGSPLLQKSLLLLSSSRGLVWTAGAIRGQAFEEH